MVKNYFTRALAICAALVLFACSSGVGSISNLEKAYKEDNLELIKDEAPKLYDAKESLSAEELATLALSYLYVSDNIALQNLEAGNMSMGEGKDYARKAVELYKAALQKDATATDKKLQELNPMGKEGLEVAQSMMELL